MRLLLAEDDAMIGESVCRGLRQDGFAVDWVRDGRAAEVPRVADGDDVHVHAGLVRAPRNEVAVAGVVAKAEDDGAERSASAVVWGRPATTSEA